MKTTKRVFAVLMAAALVLLCTLTAFAETNQADLTVSGDNLAGKTVTVINMFSDTSSTTDANPAYSLRDAWKPFFADKLGIQSNDPDISTKAYRYVVAMADDSPELIALAEAARVYYVEQKENNPNYFITETQQTANALGTATFSNLNAGTYLVLPAGGSTSATRGTDAMIVTIRNSDVDIDMKSEYPTVEKQVRPADSNGSFAEDTSANVGDMVQFELVSAVPEMSDYDTYVFNFKDTLSSGLTLIKDATNYPDYPMVLSIDGVTLTENVDYTFTQNGQSFVVAITDLKDLVENNDDISVDDAITLTYFAELNANAQVGTDGNSNRATVEYSNDPSSDGTGESAPDISTVYTYQITIHKFSKDGTDEVPLAGAKFEIYNTAADAVNRAPIALIETTTANTYRVATPQEIADANVDKVTEVVTPASGMIMINGLDLGTYYLKETEAPTGYNQLSSEVTVVISTDNSATSGTVEDDYTNVYYTVNGTQNNSANNSTVKIENRPGSMLPTTGSTGTVWLTIAGVAVVILGIVFTSRRKKTTKAD